jgi:signal transduction histidine kinase
MMNPVQSQPQTPDAVEFVKQSAELVSIENLRAERRFAVNQPVQVTLLGTPECRFSALVRNVSHKGLRLEVDGAIVASGSAAKVEWNDRVLVGSIRHRSERGGSTVLGLELYSSWESFLEEILAHQAARLERGHLELQGLASVAAREMQETLSVVLLYLDLLARSSACKEDAESRELIGCAQSGATRTRQLTHDLFAYSQVVTESMDYNPVNCDRLVRAAASLYAGDARAVVTQDHLPTVMGHGPELRMLFQHLIANGLKFNRSEERRVHVSAKFRKTEWMFSVTDNGIGIEPQDIARLFQPFVRLGKAAQFPGSGLGLALAQRVVEKHGGRMWPESEPGKGSSFHFTVPARPTPWQ